MKLAFTSIVALALSASLAIAGGNNHGYGGQTNYSGSVGAQSYAAGGSVTGVLGNGYSAQGSISGATQSSGLNFDRGSDSLVINTFTYGADGSASGGITGGNAFGATGGIAVREGWSQGHGTIRSNRRGW